MTDRLDTLLAPTALTGCVVDGRAGDTLLAPTVSAGVWGSTARWNGRLPIPTSGEFAYLLLGEIHKKKMFEFSELAYFLVFLKKLSYKSQMRSGIIE